MDTADILQASTERVNTIKQRLVEMFFVIVVVVLGIFLGLWFADFGRTITSGPVSAPVSSPFDWCAHAKKFPELYNPLVYCRVSNPISAPRPSFCDVCITQPDLTICKTLCK